MLVEILLPASVAFSGVAVRTFAYLLIGSHVVTTHSLI
jgi:hypothetical protein